ncbi:bifunctional tRNA (5-methylaminomethyl-2-thiouridine)(34)-methyltransferase MnmD/FAD-dependent 5-carboxymethylaminomethyl-2-thiouridine(34) oxidoreductase MnmC [Marinimicrobium sp. ABcell2]|uniref:bifunctional tRNA (5-methylaminomethyl-2-thiouridine)(34)-methyltransferase MnmD/FAD-dependent 5-carboxymethylaminomethyl-2-thiouridine(34) oxidoreductase MnmC n=1 Tax=Marinimicrobium sp. ABcell2 TaxID=3069751 RepID=UPI0027B2846D|nr:bifunctional tRNA (5-methylaminomethyl-2-thiouridine)(34)-methyltransferase MnmD/FAD-dependent 5-carboxymethylaminomethyl-2-thiouridine(34) oxidoreductase MnmC [Marinimicrobium sp. ABcell2]MDQ2075214.1 bifunctional tRNA (5-methylaminomethyl-2-thiouridine)(34)-methyltransferase MnmD/FAD-dependent 5-carboxymethylaminomethyl-2-thiouridine(34) oxidoreductase MnmC [Marinimicrobium sp. ABcell2]
MSDDGAPKPAEISWDEDGQPLSTVFGDVYFSRQDGLAETRHVFLHHNQLPERFAQLKDEDHFCIGETGFGSGLNFLATWQLWQQCAPAGAQLDFVSVEKFPLQKHDLARALSLWPELAPFANPLLEAFPPPQGGFHRLEFAGGKIRLTLIVDEAAQGLAQLLASDHPLFRAAGITMDAWFLDGFAPSKNPDMWRPELFTVIGELSGSGTTAATFSAASVVKQGLAQAGFSITKVPGFGRKREMIRAARANTVSSTHSPTTRWNKNTPPWDLPPKSVDASKKAIVIGGGLAGCHTARALADRNYEVTLLERQSHLAAEGSGNPQGVLYAKLSHQASPLGEFNLASLMYAQRHYQPFWQAGPAYGEACGVLQLAYNASEQALQEQLRERLSQHEGFLSFVNQDQASEIAGIALPYGGLYFPQAGWLAPPQVCARLIDHPKIQVRSVTEVTELAYDEDWQVSLADGSTLHSDLVVIANAFDARRFAQTRDLPLKSIRGQVTYLPATERSHQLRAALCAEGYLAPAQNGVHCAGASFNLGDSNPALTEQDHHTNLNKLSYFGSELSGLWPHADSHSLDGRVAFRCATRDYLPVVGPVPRREQFLEDYAPLRKDAHADIPIPGAYWPGLYVNLGHGSRGLAYTPLCAQLLAALICGESRPMSRDLARALHPARFLIRDLIRSRV